jgi:hypothetical protein
LTFLVIASKQFHKAKVPRQAERIFFLHSKNVRDNHIHHVCQELGLQDKSKLEEVEEVAS